MTAIIAEKPSVGMDIARVVGADRKNDGYCAGGGYMVTWALGHLVSLALPDAYGYTKTAAEDLPMLPEPFRLVSSQVRTDRGMVPDLAASKQLRIIESVFNRCGSIIVATDAGREGELIFRWIYDYLGCTKPFRRLWISSLTAKADWLVGMNASRALAIASGTPNSSIGRVQTPTLAMICARFRENREFVSAPYWQLHITLDGKESYRRFFRVGNFGDKAEAEAAYRSIPSGSVAEITKAERREVQQQPPLLYDLTALQKDCNVHLDLPAAKTLDIAQTLYEKKLISYPRTGSRHIPQNVMAHVPELLEKISAMPEFREYGKALDLSALNTRSVDDTEVTDHHALITTDITPEGLSEAESAIYVLIAGRMLEAFSPCCKKETLLMECRIGETVFRSKSSAVASPGWRGVFGRKEDKEEDGDGLNDGHAVFSEGDRIPVSGHGLVQKKTMPKPLYTEATLLAAMETCGKDIADGEAREAVKDIGIGTPATRAAIITTLFKRDYIERNGKSLVPTEKGLLLYGAVKDMLVADASLTGSWENALSQIERHTLDPDVFMASIRDYTRKATGEILRLSLPAAPVRTFTCPKCRTGHVILKGRTAKCDNGGCGLLVFRKFLNKELTDRHLEQLLSSGSTSLIKGFKGKKGVAFNAAVAFDAEFNLVLSFPKDGKGRKK